MRHACRKAFQVVGLWHVGLWQGYRSQCGEIFSSAAQIDIGQHATASERGDVVHSSPQQIAPAFQAAGSIPSLRPETKVRQP